MSRRLFHTPYIFSQIYAFENSQKESKEKTYSLKSYLFSLDKLFLLLFFLWTLDNRPLVARVVDLLEHLVHPAVTLALDEADAGLGMPRVIVVLFVSNFSHLGRLCRAVLAGVPHVARLACFADSRGSLYFRNHIIVNSVWEFAHFRPFRRPSPCPSPSLRLPT